MQFEIKYLGVNYKVVVVVHMDDSVQVTFMDNTTLRTVTMYPVEFVSATHWVKK